MIFVISQKKLRKYEKTDISTIFKEINKKTYSNKFNLIRPK